MKMLHLVAFGLLVVGGLNWGLVGLLDYNLVEVLLGKTGLVSIVYVLVGASALYLAMTHMSDCKMCAKK